MSYYGRFFLVVALVSAHERYLVTDTQYSGKGCVEFKQRNKRYTVAECTKEHTLECEDIPITKDGVTSWESRDVTCEKYDHFHINYTIIPFPQPTNPPAKPGNGGLDPHFRKLNGNLFSYHGECDLVFVSSSSFASGAGLDIHIRTKIRKTYSFIAAVAMRVGNGTFEMEGKHSFRINDETFHHPPSQFHKYPISNIKNATWCRERCSNAQIYRIDFDHGEYVEFANWAGFLHIEVNGVFDDSLGLLGNRWDCGMAGRDGKLINDVDEYGQDWQVLDSDPQIFRTSRYPQHPKRCILPKVTFRRIPQQNTRLAERTCSYLSGELKAMCVFDVTATGDERLALSPFYG